jgi:TonB family protein
MNKYFLAGCLIFCSLSIFAQATKTVTKDSSITGISEIYNVLKQDKKIRHGSYQVRQTILNKVLVSGFYKNNLKDSVWVSYTFTGAVIDSGSYNNGNKIGVWRYSSQNGKPENIYNYSTGRLMYHQSNPADTIKYTIITDGGIKTLTRLEQVPIYIPGANTIYQSIAKAMRYPRTAMERRIAGKVVVGFTVNEQGHAKDHHVINSVDPSLDAEALRCVKLIKDEWAPGMLNGKPVAAIVTMPIIFMLQPY